MTTVNMHWMVNVIVFLVCLLYIYLYFVHTYTVLLLAYFYYVLYIIYIVFPVNVIYFIYAYYAPTNYNQIVPALTAIYCQCSACMFSKYFSKFLLI